MSPSLEDLESRARARFGSLTVIESGLLQAVPQGQTIACGPPSDPARAENWMAEHQVRAELLVWLCSDPLAIELVHPRGIRICSALVAGLLDISHARLPFGLTFQRCRFSGDIILRGAEIPLIDLEGTWVRSIVADLVRVSGSVYLRNGFHADGTVHFMDAEVTGTFECSDSVLSITPELRTKPWSAALNLERSVIKGSVFLRNGFRADGGVRLLHARIGGDLDCEGGTIPKPTTSGCAIRRRRT